MKKSLPLFALLLVGCATKIDPHHTIKIDSDPPGARVYFGAGPTEGSAEKARQYVGTAPCTWSVTGNPDNGEFIIPGGLVYSLAVQPAAVFIAEPPSGATNLFVKRQVFHSGSILQGGDRIPEALFFDLTKPNGK